jgi:hypothetical protein
MKDSHLDELVRLAYEAYGEQVRWKNYADLAMPPYDELGEKVQAGWRAAVLAVVNAPSRDRDGS